MFQLIISILAIILAVALAGVSVYYGGSAFSNGAESAAYSALTNQGAQIEAAMTLHRAQAGEQPLDLDELETDNYLKQVPVASDVTTDWTLVDVNGDGSFDSIVVVGLGDAVCAVDTVQVAISADTTAAVQAAFTGVSGCTTTGAPLTVGTAINAGFAAANSTTVFYYNL